MLYSFKAKYVLEICSNFNFQGINFIQSFSNQFIQSRHWLVCTQTNSNERYTFRSSFHRLTDNISCSTFDGARFLFVTQIFRNTELNHSKWQIKIPTVSRNSGRTSLSQVIWKCFVKMIWLKCFLSNWKEDKDHPTIFARSIYPVIYVQNTTSWKSYI